MCKSLKFLSISAQQILNLMINIATIGKNLIYGSIFVILQCNVSLILEYYAKIADDVI